MITLQYPFLHLSFLKCFDALPNSFVYSADLANAFLIARIVDLNDAFGFTNFNFHLKFFILNLNLM